MYDKTALIPERSIPSHQGSSLWQKGALATATALALLGVHLDANALALGAIQVKSALGEPLRAEIEVPDITSEEASTFQAALGSPQAFQAAGVDYSQALRGTHVTLARRPNGQVYLRIQGQAPVNEPFIGLVIEANWANGHVVRDYTLLIDPSPSATPTQPPPQNNAPVLPSQPPQQQQQQQQLVPPPAQPAARPPATLQPARPGRSVFNTPSSSSGKAGGEQVRVRPGDTAAGLAQAHLSEGVSLDQMLIAMLRANPQAFIHGNVNLIRAGAVLDMPSSDQASSVAPTSARRAVIAQSRDFHAYRQGIAGIASRSRSIASGNQRSASGRVRPQVQESNTASTPPDRLTVSRGGGSGSGSNASATNRAETRVALSRQAQEQAARTAELNRNIKDLSKLAAASADTAGSSAKPSKAAVPAVNVPVASSVTTAAAVSSPTKPAAAASTPASSATPAASAPAKSASAPAKNASTPASKPHFAPPQAPPAETSSVFDSLLDNWPLLAAIVVVLVALGSYIGLRRGKSRNGASRDETRIDSESPFSDSKRAHDSFFDAEGGEHVDTRDSAESGASSSMAYSHSQLEAAGDVDPISEAEVYLAYGRDAQAEEILKEALRTYPGRSSIYLKLAEIYAKRRDAHLLETTATEARRITRGEGSDWQAIVNLGQELDPSNPLYQSSSSNAANNAFNNMPSSAQPDAPAADMPLQQAEHDEAADAPKSSVDLDLSEPAALTADDEPPSHYSEQFPPTIPVPARFDPRIPRTTAPQPLSSGKPVDFTPPAAPARTTPQEDSGLMEFDLDSISAAPPNSNAAAPSNSNADALTKPVALGDEDPLATKLALAQEFRAIGDIDSARNLIKEVLNEASGSLKIKAARFLSELN